MVTALKFWLKEIRLNCRGRNWALKSYMNVPVFSPVKQKHPHIFKLAPKKSLFQLLAVMMSMPLSFSASTTHR
jgi:hypothetical protein